MQSVTDMLKINDLILLSYQARMDPYWGKLVLTRYRSTVYVFRIIWEAL